MHSSTNVTPRALLITGTVGSGKTTVAEALGDLLIDAKVPHAVTDVAAAVMDAANWR